MRAASPIEVVGTDDISNVSIRQSSPSTEGELISTP